jgi:antitoxin ParD1/3/4
MVSISLKPAQQKFIQEQVALGRFNSEAEVLEMALQLLASHYHDDWIIETRAKIMEAQMEIDRGEGIPINVAMAQLRTNLHRTPEK